MARPLGQAGVRARRQRRFADGRTSSTIICRAVGNRLVIEVLSPSTTRTDRTTKAQLYARYGVPYYWIVDPEARVIEVHRLGGGRCASSEVFGGEHLTDVPPFPGLRLDAASLWRR